MARPSEIIYGWVGAKQGSITHHQIVDTYNEIKPLPRGTKMNYVWSWCAATVSAAYHLAGLDNIFPSEMSCIKMIEKAKKMGIWVEDDSYIPKQDDVIIYAWDDNKNTFAKYDNTSGHDHTGIVLNVSNGVINVVEGNKGTPGKVGIRQVPINGWGIRGFIVPKMPTTVPTTPAKETKDLEKVAREVIQGKWDNGVKRRQLLTQAGYDYAEVQKKVNELLK